MIKFRIAKSDRCQSEYSVFVSFDFDMRIISVLKSYSTHYWNPETKEWEIALKDFDYVRHDLQDYQAIIVDERVFDSQEEKRCSNDLKMSLEKIYNPKTKPFDHQTYGVKYGLEHTRWLLGDEQGLGKTKQAIDIAVIQKEQLGYEHCLIICGVNGLKWNWQNEIKTHSNESGYILGQRLVKGRLVVRGNKEKIEDLKNIKNIKDYFIITNVESLRSKEICEMLQKLCKNNVIGMSVADEVHKMKNPTSQQGKAFLKICPEYRLAITGTPLMNNPLDLYIILKWLGYEQHAFYAFKNHYCIMGGFGGYEIVGYRNLNEVRDTLDNMMLRRLKKDVLDLPEKLYVDEYVEMNLKQEQIYKEVFNQVRMNIDQIMLSPNPLTQLIRLRQATGYTGILSSVVQESAKLDRCEELVEDAIENGKKVVIFSNWTQMTEVVYARLSKKYKGVLITGDVKDSERQENVNMFQNDDKCKFLVGTIGAAGTGLTLTAGSVEIFLDEPWNRALFDQAVDRCHRVGTTENVTVYTLLTKNTIDERIHEIVQQKGQLSDMIIDNQIVGNKKEILDYLLQ